MQFIRKMVKQLGPIKRIISERDELTVERHYLLQQQQLWSTERETLIKEIKQHKDAIPITRQTDVRSELSFKFIRGKGIEIGALHGPLPYSSEKAHVKYVDRMCVDDLYTHYPELRAHPLVAVDIIDDGEKLTKIADQSQDFIIANHLLEHCQDPIGTLMVFEQKLRPGGILYVAIPDKRETFDRDRVTTDLEHLICDHKEGPARSRKQHFEEWVSIWIKDRQSQAYLDRVKELMEMDYSIHYHVWTEKEFLELLLHSIRNHTPTFNIRAFHQNGEEFISILQRST